MSHNPNTVKSQSDLNPCNDGKRSSDVLIATIEELEQTKKQLEQMRRNHKEHCIVIDELRVCLLNCRNYFVSNNIEFFVNQIDKTLKKYERD